MKRPLQKYIPKNKNLIEYAESINNLEKIGAIHKSNHCNGEFISTYFLRTKPNGKERFILNLKHLNTYLSCPHFKLEDFRSVKKILFENCYMGNRDLNDAYFRAYFLVSIHKNSRKYLKSQYRQQLYEFTCLPFGLSTAPFIFTKIF